GSGCVPGRRVRRHHAAGDDVPLDSAAGRRAERPIRRCAGCRGRDRAAGGEPRGRWRGILPRVVHHESGTARRGGDAGGEGPAGDGRKSLSTTSTSWVDGAWLLVAAWAAALAPVSASARQSSTAALAPVSASARQSSTAARASALASARQSSAAAPPVLRWGGDAEGGAPFVEADPRDPTTMRGFDVEIAEMIARGLGRTPRFV